jgi:phosphoribosylformylglycinamidine synthase subunit PurQ / glutaminase
LARKISYFTENTSQKSFFLYNLGENMKPSVIVLGGYGINSEAETIFAFNQAGADAKYVHVADLIEKPGILEEAQILMIPGGFSFGDHTGSGKALSNLLFDKIGKQILNFVKRDTLTLGICNGFQVLVALGLVPALNEKYGERQAGLLTNTSNRFVCRYVHLKNQSEKCVWTKGIDMLFLPVAHGEGNFFLPEESMDQLEKNDQIIFSYVNENGSPANGEFPANPNGAQRDIAAVCDPSGRIMGMMPHPERGLWFSNRPDFTLAKEKLIRAGKNVPEWTSNLDIFKNAVEYFQHK